MSQKVDIAKLTFDEYKTHRVITSFRNGICPSGMKIINEWPEVPLVYLAFTHRRDPIADLSWVCSVYYWELRFGIRHNIERLCIEKEIDNSAKFINFFRKYRKANP